MRKSIKTVLAFLLAVSYICSTVASATTLAGETTLSEGIDYAAQGSESKWEAEPAQESESMRETESAQETESTQESETTEEAFYAEKELSGVLVTVQADAGVFPSGATLRVRKLSLDEERKVDSAVKEKLELDQQNLLQSIIFDISVLDRDGEEVQPDTTKGEVKVQFSNIPLFTGGCGKADFRISLK